MVFKKSLLVLFIMLFSSAGFSQSDNFRFIKYLQEKPNEPTAFAVAYKGEKTLSTLHRHNINIKHITPNWVFIQTTPTIINSLSKNKEIEQFYFEFHNGQPLSDTARIVQHVKEVHDGYGDLIRGYTGKNVLIGFVDQGLDWTHPDFIDENGVRRVIAYWDQSAPTNTTAPQPYNYGQSCDSLSIANGTCTLTESGTYHGSTVTGTATGNGRANGKNKGMAPDSKIVVIETDFNKANWTLTVADACDYLFRIADSLGIPAVMNLSVGSYFGSHDGNDPASELMEQMIDSKKGRIIVGAAGNSGDKGNYHLKGKIYNDTNFVWFRNNPSNQILANSVYFDWWSDTALSNQLNIAFAANDSLTFSQTPYSTFYNLKTMASYVQDTLRTVNGAQLAVVEIYKTLVGDSYNIEALIRNYDSLGYFYQLAVSGLGQFDLWSGKWADLNDMITTLPDAATFPGIAKYMRPDSLSTLVSSWACSEKIMTVGNIRNRLTHINNNGVENPYNPYPPVGYIAHHSSRGPSRKGVLKPNVTSNGDMMLGAAPAFMRASSSYNTALDLGGWHARNGGTSMASPVVAGIAALYLEKCPGSSYSDFIRDAMNNTDTYIHYGTVPNYTYGPGRINAYKLVAHNGTFSNNMGYCGADFNLGITSLDSLRNFQWSTGDTTEQIVISSPGTYSVSFEYGENCYSTLTKVVEAGSPPIQPLISASGNILTSTSAHSYQWYRNGEKLENETGQQLTIVTGGNYQVKVSDSAGCSNYSDYYHSTLSVSEIGKHTTIYPNPTEDLLFISSDAEIENYSIYSIDGVLIESDRFKDTPVSLKKLANGTYIIKVENAFFVKTFKILKN